MICLKVGENAPQQSWYSFDYTGKIKEGQSPFTKDLHHEVVREENIENTRE